ncbi:hypothetical protein HZS_4967 [Henneguya salminicola]|nr:hypothetical protein HZS_4967 [Henneguya salminicola]
MFVRQYKFSNHQRLTKIYYFYMKESYSFNDLTDNFLKSDYHFWFTITKLGMFQKPAAEIYETLYKKEYSGDEEIVSDVQYFLIKL